MVSTSKVKLIVLCVFSLLMVLWGVSGIYSTPAKVAEAFDDVGMPPDAVATPNGDYIGSESCKECHEKEYKDYVTTKHARLSERAGWKEKVQGCESCHGPGKAHLEDATDPSRIISFKGKSSKVISENCLTCHAGKEAHNNFRRGEHWRNDVGCTDCHSAHGGSHGMMKPGSMTLIGDSSDQNPGTATTAMLKGSEPGLCISCHSETKSQFSKPFRHKVLEGVMKCSDCHNPHGGFEAKQTKLAGGVDAACLKCHTDKQGPFIYEHAPLKIEGCVACHSPHGSANPKQLKRPQVRQLCLECHSGITDQLADGPGSGPHSQASVRSQNCTVCHSRIHGSNAHKAFFR